MLSSWLSFFCGYGAGGLMVGEGENGWTEERDGDRVRVAGSSAWWRVTMVGEDHREGCGHGQGETGNMGEGEEGEVVSGREDNKRKTGDVGIY